MDTTRIALARVLELGVRISWHEAVAIVVQAAALESSVKPTNARRPRIDSLSCVLGRGGDVEFTELSASKQPDPGALMGLLREALDDPESPPELVKFAQQQSSTNLVDDLAPWASATKRQRVEVASVAIRGLAAEAELARRTVDVLRGLPVEANRTPPFDGADATTGIAEDAEFNRLPEKVGHGAAGFSRRRLYRWTIDRRTAVGILVVLILALGWWLITPGAPVLPPPRSLSRMPRPLEPVALNTNWARTDVAGGASTRTARAAPPITDAEAGPSAAPATGALPESVTPGPVVDVVPPAPAPAQLPALPPATPPPPPDGTIYSAANVNVEPPVLRYPNLPRAVQAADASITGPYFEVLVDPRGKVETVRLRGRVDRSETYYRHRMMLAAAKTWQFTPARREGQPVRYVARVAIQP